MDKEKRNADIRGSLINGDNMTILVTGFDPFGGETVNPAYEAVKLLPDSISGADIVKQLIPTSFRRSGEVLEIAIVRCCPDAVICVGQAGGRAAITPERIAVNLMDSTSPDNDGYIPTDLPVCEDGENAYFSTLPVKEMVSAIKKTGVNAALSLSAGTFVCNSLMYRLLYLAETKYPGMRGGFIHVPYLTVQTAGKRPGTPGMEMCDIVCGLNAAITAVVRSLSR